MLLNNIKELAQLVYPKVLKHRRHLHQFPELSFQEHETSAYIKSTLDTLAIPWTSIAGTGVLAVITGDQPSGKVIALRADMDALPITELNDVEYASTRPGVMHACGHDVHTSSLLGVATILQSIKADFGGTVKLLFQPGEEILPGGANQMIQEGALLDPVPTAVIGQHVIPSLPAGKIALRKGRFMASKDDLHITVYGKGGHGAMPHENIDPVLIASHIVVALQQLVSRISNPATPGVLSIGRMIADGSYNVIPDKVIMEGAFRTMDENWRLIALEKIIKLSEGIAESMGGKCECRIERGYPFLTNEEKLTQRVDQYAREYVGNENVQEADIWMASEDFAYYSQTTDACFYLLGTGNAAAGISSSLHTPTFNIDETSLELSIGLMAYIALSELGNKPA